MRRICSMSYTTHANRSFCDKMCLALRRLVAWVNFHSKTDRDDCPLRSVRIIWDNVRGSLQRATKKWIESRSEIRMEPTTSSLLQIDLSDHWTCPHCIGGSSHIHKNIFHSVHVEPDFWSRKNRIITQRVPPNPVVFSWQIQRLIIFILLILNPTNLWFLGGV